MMAPAFRPTRPQRHRSKALVAGLAWATGCPLLAEVGAPPDGAAATMARVAARDAVRREIDAALDEALGLSARGRAPEAVATLEAALARADGLGDAGVDEQGRVRSTLAQVLVAADRPAAAEPYLRQLLALHRARGVDPAYDAPHFEALASVLMREQRLAAARRELEAGLRALATPPKGSSPAGLDALEGWKGRLTALGAQLDLAQGRAEAALAGYDRALAILRPRATPPPLLVMIEGGRIEAAVRAGRLGDVRATATAFLKDVEAKAGPDAPVTRMAALTAAEAALATGAPRAEVEALVGRAGPFDGPGTFPPATAKALWIRGRIHLQDGRNAEAEAALARALELYQSQRQATGALQDELAAALEAQGKKARAVKVRRLAREARLGRP